MGFDGKLSSVPVIQARISHAIDISGVQVRPLALRRAVHAGVFKKSLACVAV